MAELVLIVSGGGKKRYLIRKPRILIGSGAENDIVLSGEEVAETHCLVQKVDEVFSVLDLGTEAGVMVNASAITEHELQDGDTISIGPNQFVFLSAEPDQNQTPNDEAFSNRVDESKTDISEWREAQWRVGEDHTEGDFLPVRLIIFHRGNIVREVPLVAETYCLGRDKRNEIVLEEADISRRHSRISRVGDSFLIEDLDSSNGTFVNRTKIFGKQQLKNGDEISIGRYDLLFQMLVSDPSTDQTLLHDLDYDEDRTLVSDDLATAGDAPPRLVVISDLLRGREFPLKKGMNSIGRDDSNDVTLDDNSVSRRHAVILFENDKYKIEDQQSLNGIEINGQPVHLSELKAGDEITVGLVALRFVAGGEVFALPVTSERTPTTTAKSKNVFRTIPIIVVGGILGALLIVAVIAALLVPALKQGSKAPTNKTAARVAGDTAGSDLSAYQGISRGREYMDAYRWNLAIQEFDRVLARQPDNLEILRLKEKAALERANMQTMDLAKAKMEAGHFQETLDLLQAIAEGSVYGTIVDKRIEAAKQAFAQSYVDAGTRKLADGSIFEAIADFDQALKIDSNNEDAVVLRRRAMEKKQKPPPAPAQRKVDLAGRKSQAQTIIDRSLDLYLQGEPTAAAEAINRVLTLGISASDPLVKKAYRNKGIYDRINDRYQRGLSYYNAGDLQSAYSEWIQVLSLDREITAGRRSVIFTKIEGPLVQALSSQAEMDYSAGHYCSARRNWQNLLSFSNNFLEARQGIEKVDQLIKDTYREGYFQEDVNPTIARQSYEEVVAMTCPDHEYHAKALKALQHLSQ